MIAEKLMRVGGVAVPESTFTTFAASAGQNDGEVWYPDKNLVVGKVDNTQAGDGETQPQSSLILFKGDDLSGTQSGMYGVFQGSSGTALVDVFANDTATSRVWFYSNTSPCQPALSPDKTMLAYMTTGSVPIIVTPETNATITTLSYSTSNEGSNLFSFSPDGAYLLAVNATHVEVFDTSTWTSIATALDTVEKVNNVAWSNDSTMFALVAKAGATSNSLTVTTVGASMTLGDVFVSDLVSDKDGFGVCWHPDDSVLYVSERTSSVGINNLQAFETSGWTVSLGVETGVILSNLEMHPDGTYLLATPDTSSKVRKYYTSDLSEDTTFNAGFRTYLKVTGAAFSKDEAGPFELPISHSRYSGAAFNLTAPMNNGCGVCITPDDLHVYATDESNKNVQWLILSTEADVRTGTLQTQKLFTEGPAGGYRGVFVSGDGTKLYLSDTGEVLHQYTMSTPYDLTTATADSKTVDITAYSTDTWDVHFSGDGTKLYIIGNGNTVVIHYNLSTAWDISTATYVANKNVFSQATDPRGLALHPDGTKMWVNDYTTDECFEYNLSTAWDLTTAVYSGESIKISSFADDRSKGISWCNDRRFWLFGTDNDYIYQMAIPYIA